MSPGTLFHRIAAHFNSAWPRATLRMYLFAVIVLATLPLAGFLIWQNVSDIRSQQRQIEDSLARSAAAFARSVERELASSTEALNVLSQSELFQQDRVRTLGRLLQGRPRRDWDSIVILDRDGALLLDTGTQRSRQDEQPRLREVHERVMRDREPAVFGVASPGSAAGRAVIVALPVMQNGTPRYVLAARMHESVWPRLAGSASLPQNARASLFDERQRLVGHSDTGFAPGTQLPDAAQMEMRQSASGVHRSVSIDGVEVLAAWESLPQSGWVARVVLPAGPIDSAHRKTIVAALSSSGLNLLVGLLLAALVARRIGRPLRVLATRGPQALPQRLEIREVALLRDALLLAQQRDEAANLERAQLTERAVEAGRKAQAASRAKDEFLTMLSHELRNPLGAISAAVDVLDSADHQSETAVEARDIIARQTRNLAHMMNDLLDVGRVIAGKITLSRRPVSLGAIVQRVQETLAMTGEARSHDLRLEVEDAWVHGDSVRLEQVVINLVTNALKYTPAGRVVRIVLRREGPDAVLQVCDAGMGIPADLLPHVFDLFVQGERTLDRRAGGLGIGLTLVRRIVELHGGTVAAESSDEGSCFTVRLPVVEQPEQENEDALPPSRRRSVLVVEDNSDVLSALRSKLELDGHTVTTAIDGVEGLGSLLRVRPEVSIVDIGLPGLTGFELARHARAAGYAGRMIALSGYGAERDLKEALVAGFDAYLVKPVDRQQLRASMSVE